MAKVSERALSRRQLRGAEGDYSWFDLYPDESYIDSLEKSGLAIHHRSRWLNAVSVSGKMADLAGVRQFSFVREIKPVATFRGHRIEIDSKQPPGRAVPAALDYGPSYNQLHLCQIDSLHGLGYSGKDIYIGIMDTGYDLEHPAFQRLIENGRLIATHDFINGDDDVQDDRDIQRQHGTLTLSAVGGSDEGALIGAGYEAGFVLTKTEIVTDEIQSEEDNWVAAAEWMEAVGVDIISSSLGYIDWYDVSELDGNTAAITRAADIAASLGVAVVNAAGNERLSFWGRIIPPADGDSVIAVGGVNSTGQLYSQSSPGPTADGRIKPDVMAQAVGVWAADYSSGGYRTSTGTSLAAPIISGGLALALEAHPDWDLDKLYDGLRSTAGNAGSPDNDMGWGIARIFDLFAVDGYFIVDEPAAVINQGDTVEIGIALFDSSSAPGGSHDIEVSLVAGTAEIVGTPFTSGPDSLTQIVYFPFPGIQKIQIYDRIARLSKMLELLVYGRIDINFAIIPSPARDSVVFLFELAQPSLAEISIFTVAGDKVAEASIQAGSALNKYVWLARNNRGEKIASGIYIAQLRTAFGRQTTKFAFVK